MDALEKLTGRKLSVLHIVGGGSRNDLLNQATADATGRTVVAGPVEATAAGNILIQAVAMKEIRGLKGVREVVRKSFPSKTYRPSSDARWAGALRSFKSLKRA
jgi:rhamnulokinase